MPPHEFREGVFRAIYCVTTKQFGVIDHNSHIKQRRFKKRTRIGVPKPVGLRTRNQPDRVNRLRPSKLTRPSRVEDYVDFGVYNSKQICVYTCQ